MEVSPNLLRQKTVQIYKRVSDLLEDVEQDEALTSLQKTELEASLLQSKSQCLNTLVLLSDRGKR